MPNILTILLSSRWRGGRGESPTDWTGPWTAEHATRAQHQGWQGTDRSVVGATGV